MDDKERLQRAQVFAEKKHDGQFRIGGDPYITHPMEVARIVKEQGYGIDYQITALFHDLLEDTDATEQEIEEIGGKNVLEAVKILTKEDGYVMAEYVAAIKQNEIAFAVKAADRLHNLNSALCTNTEFKRKYILETVDWYLGFSKEICQAVKTLAESLEMPMTEMPFLYEPIESWKLHKV